VVNRENLIRTIDGSKSAKKKTWREKGGERFLASKTSEKTGGKNCRSEAAGNDCDARRKITSPGRGAEGERRAYLKWWGTPKQANENIPGDRQSCLLDIQAQSGGGPHWGGSDANFCR